MVNPHYDLCIIGGGPAGYAAAMRALDFGKKVCLIEKEKIGGAGIYNGALASKAMWEKSMRYFFLKEESGTAPPIEFKDVMDTVNSALFERKFQLACHIKLLQTEPGQGVFKYERGHGYILNPNSVEIKRESGSKYISCDFIILATGSRPRVLPEILVDEKNIVTSDGIFSWDKFPQSMVVLGAGVIGCEFATIFSNFGRTEVFLIDKAERILPFEDEDIANLVSSNFEKGGSKIHRSSRFDGMKVNSRGWVNYELTNSEGERKVFEVEKAIISVGRVPNCENLGLENVDIRFLPSGHIQTSETQTNVSTIYAVGDLIGHMALVNMAEVQGRHAVEKMFGVPNRTLNYQNISTIMFLNPEVASVGLNEQMVIEMNLPVRVVKIDYSCISRAIAMRKTQGFFKIIVSDDAEMKILGMRAIGEHASSAIQTVALLISMNMGIDELADLVHPHPSIIEGVQECVRMLRGKSIFKPIVFKDKLSCYRLVNGAKIPMEFLP